MVRRSIHIDAPVEAVYEFLDDPRNHLEVTPGIEAIRDIERLDNGGKRVEYTYEMAGVPISGELIERRHSDNELLRFEMRGTLTGEITIETVPAGDGTELAYSAEYDIPGRVLSAVARPVVRRYNTRQLQSTLENTKAQLETDA